MEGTKYDQEKPRWSLLPWKETEQVVQVLTHGSKKYDDFNWQKVPNARDRYFSAAMRHLIAWKNNEKMDGETKLPHLASVICNILFLMWMDNNEV